MQIRHTAGEPAERKGFRYEPCTADEYPDGIDFSSEATARVTKEVGECLAAELDNIEIVDADTNDLADAPDEGGDA